MMEAAGNRSCRGVAAAGGAYGVARLGFAHGIACLGSAWRTLGLVLAAGAVPAPGLPLLDRTCLARPERPVAAGCRLARRAPWPHRMPCRRCGGPAVAGPAGLFRPVDRRRYRALYRRPAGLPA